MRLRLWPSAHPANAEGVDLIVAPLALCLQLASASACAGAATIVGSDGTLLYALGAAKGLNMEAAESLACAAAPLSAPSSLVACASTGAHALPAALGLQLWPAAHPANAQGVDLIVAPLALCEQMTSVPACAGAAAIAGDNGVTRYVVGTAAALRMEAAAVLHCA
jgi:hypothetical protein